MSTHGLMLALAGAQVDCLHYRMGLDPGNASLRAAYARAHRVVADLTPPPAQPRTWAPIEHVDRWQEWDAAFAHMKESRAALDALDYDSPDRPGAWSAHERARSALYDFGVIERSTHAGWSVEVQRADCDFAFDQLFSVSHTFTHCDDPAPLGIFGRHDRRRAPEYAAAVLAWIVDPRGGYPE